MKTFTLHRVSPSSYSKVGNLAPIKIAPRKEKKAGGRINARETCEGYTIMIASNICVKFESEVVNEKQTCFWDHHEYDGPKVTIPYVHKKEKITSGGYQHRFIGPGSFCDIFCLWSYLKEEMKKIASLRDPRLEEAVANCQFAFELMFSSNNVLHVRPNFQILQRYGGPMTIESYRNATHDKKYVKTPEVVFDSAILNFFVQ